MKANMVICMDNNNGRLFYSNLDNLIAIVSKDMVSRTSILRPLKIYYSNQINCNLNLVKLYDLDDILPPDQVQLVLFKLNIFHLSYKAKVLQETLDADYWLQHHLSIGKSIPKKQIIVSDT